MSPRPIRIDPWITVEWPAAFPRTVDEMAAEVGWEVRERKGVLQVCLPERLEVRSVTPFGFIRVGERASGAFRLDRLRQWQDHGSLGFPPKLLQEVAAVRASHPTLAVRISGLKLAVTAAAPAELPNVINDYLNLHVPEMLGGRVWIIETDHKLYDRTPSLARSLYRAAESPEVIRAAKENPEVLAGGLGLHGGDQLGGVAMVLPVLSALSPHHLGTAAGRTSGCVVFQFQDPVRDPENNLPMSLAQLHQPTSAVGMGRSELHLPEVPSSIQGEEIFSWWVKAWNRFLGQLLDPAKQFWPAAQPVFAPDLMIGRYISLLRLLGCVQEVLVNTTTDEFVRQLAMFEALDLIDGLNCGMGDYDQMARPERVQADLMRIEDHLASAPSVVDVLLPRCQRAVEALKQARGGFVLSPEDNDAQVRLVLRALRNAKHGFDKRRESGEAMRAFMGHRLDLSPDLADLAWFHFVRMLCFGQWPSAGERS